MAEKDLNDLSIEELEAILNDPSKLEESAEAETEAVAEAPEPDVPEPVEAVAEEPETPKAEDTPEPAEDLEKAELLARLEAMEARQKANDSKLGRFAGEADYWKRKAEGVRNAPEPEPIESLIDEPEPERRPAKAPARDEVLAWVIPQAIQSAAIEFETKNPEAKELQPEMTAYLQQTNYNNSALLDSDSPLAAQRETYRVLEEAYWHVKQARAEKRTQEIATRKAEQFARQKEAKQRASVSGSGGVPTPKAKAKSLDDMSVEELRGILDERAAQR